MPSVKQGGGYTLTFAKKNEDVKELLSEKKNKGVIITDYICEAIRFFEANKDKIEVSIEELVKREIAKALENISILTETPKNEDLEDNIEDIDTEED
jgi:hypothetical protein